MLNSQEIIVSVSDKHIVLCDSQGECIASSDSNKIGSQIKLPQDIFASGRKLNKTTQLKNDMMVPLNCPYKVRAFLVMNKNHKNEIPVIKNFAELLVREHLEAERPSKTSIDEFIQKIISGNLPKDKTQLSQEAKSVDLNLEVPRCAILIELKGFNDNCLESVDLDITKEKAICSKKNTIEFAINSFFTRSKDLFTAYLGNDRFVVFKTITEDEQEIFTDLIKKSYTAVF